MSEVTKKYATNSNCGSENKLCPPAPIFTNTSNTLNQSNTIRLGRKIINAKHKPLIVNDPVNILGGRSGSTGGFRGFPRNTF
jgi:hypothetical protein